MQMSILKLIAEKAEQDKRLKFTSLVHHINAPNLVQCFKKLHADKACGVDEVSVEEYERNLNDNIAKLMERLIAKKYKAHPVRRVYIPKAGKDELRPLGIPAVEDKLVQVALKEILEAIYEQDFMDCSHGFRPGRSCHTAIKQLNNAVMSKPINYVVEVDIRKFFDSVDHNKLMDLMRIRIADENLLWLVRKHLKAGVMESGTLKDTSEGTPQGGVISPLLANIYLHYVVDFWFESEFKSKTKGYTQLIRYADDFVMLCEREDEAKSFLEDLEIRLAQFGLEVSKEKTRILKFGRDPWNQTQFKESRTETFNFLGFTHYGAASRDGKFSIKHKTIKQRLAMKLVAFADWLKSIRNAVPLKGWWKIIKAKLVGHYNYFGISGNIRCLKQYYQKVLWTTFKMLNRRSQKKSMSWQQFMRYLEWNPLPKPRIKYALWSSQ